GTAVVVDDRVIEIRTANDQHWFEIIRGEIDRNRPSRRRGELVELEVAVVGIERIAARQRAVDRLTHPDPCDGRRLAATARNGSRRRAVVLTAALHVLAALADREREAAGLPVR